MLVKYISNPKISNNDSIGLISLADGIFVFTTKIISNINNKLDFQFVVCDENKNDKYGFFIKNTQFENYELTNNTFVTEIFSYNEGPVFYFNEEFEIKNEKLYKRITEKDSANKDWIDYYIKNNKTFALQNPINSDYSLIKEGKNYRILNNKFNTPLNIGIITDSTIKQSVEYDTEDLIINEEKWYRIIISEKAKLISIWTKKDNETNFKKIKTFSYPGGLEKAGIKLCYENNIKLNELSISFLKADV